MPGKQYETLFTSSCRFFFRFRFCFGFSFLSCLCCCCPGLGWSVVGGAIGVAAVVGGIGGFLDWLDWVAEIAVENCETVSWLQLCFLMAQHWQSLQNPGFVRNLPCLSHGPREKEPDRVGVIEIETKS